MRIIVDTRETEPFTFSLAGFEGTITEPEKLRTGNYSLAGLTGKVAVRYLDIVTFMAYLKNNYDWEPWFERELKRAEDMDDFVVIVDLSMLNLFSPNCDYDKGVDLCQEAQRFLKHIFGCSYMHDIPVVLAENSSAAEYIVWAFLRQYLESIHKRLARIIETHSEPVSEQQNALMNVSKLDVVSGSLLDIARGVHHQKGL